MPKTELADFFLLLSSTPPEKELVSWIISIVINIPGISKQTQIMVACVCAD